MTKGRRLPHGRRMTCLADMTESGGHVVWISRGGEISRVALVAASVRQPIVTVGVARLTWCCRVNSGQRELR
jgi:hypothetical protein